MRLKDGFQPCPKCGGSGCYWCRRQGWVVQCPQCGNGEPELILKGEDTIQCQACNASFEKTGALLPDPERKKVVAAPAPRPVVRKRA